MYLTVCLHFLFVSKRFTPMERDCYTHDEVNLESLPMKKGYRMSMKNCLYDKALFATRVSQFIKKN